MVGGGGEFEIREVPFNPDRWGPPDSSNLNLNLPVNVPFAPFSRFDKLGSSPTGLAPTSDSIFNFSNDDSFPSFGAADDDSSFRLVDGKPPPKPKWRFQQQRQLPQRRDEEVEAKKREARCFKQKHTIEPGLTGGNACPSR